MHMYCVSAKCHGVEEHMHPLFMACIVSAQGHTTIQLSIYEDFELVTV